MMSNDGKNEDSIIKYPYIIDEFLCISTFPFNFETIKYCKPTISFFFGGDRSSAPKNIINTSPSKSMVEAGGSNMKQPKEWQILRPIFLGPHSSDLVSCQFVSFAFLFLDKKIWSNDVIIFHQA